MSDQSVADNTTPQHTYDTSAPIRWWAVRRLLGSVAMLAAGYIVGGLVGVLVALLLIGLFRVD